MRKTLRGAHCDPVAAACAILKRASQLRTKEADCLGFPGARDGMLSDMALSKIVRPTGLTVHGFRASLRTWAAERMPTIPKGVAEAALAHVSPDQVIRGHRGDPGIAV